MEHRRIAVAVAAALLLTGCAARSGTSSAPRTPSDVTARVVGPQATPLVSAVDFVDRMRGWLGHAATAAFSGQPAGEGALLATSDGGRSWTRLARTQGPILAIDFLTAHKGYVVVQAQGHLDFLASTDGGRTLSTRSTPPAFGASTVELRFSSAETGFLVAGVDLDVTSDGGLRWSAQTMSLPAVAREGNSAAPDFLSASLGFLAENGAVYRTTDGGATWSEVYRLPRALDGWGGGGAAGPVAFASASVGYAVLNIPNCWAGGCPDVVLRSTDGGGVWQPVAYEMQGTLPGLAAVPSSGPPGGVGALAAWGRAGVAATTMYGLAVSSDGGVAWTSQSPGVVETPATFSLLAPRPGGGTLAAGNAYLVSIGADGSLDLLWPAPLPGVVSFVGGRTGFGLELQPTTQFLRTSDGGRTWATLATLPLPNVAGMPASVAFADARHGWAAYAFGADAHAYATSDGGRTWRALTPHGVSVVDLLPGAQGYLLATTAQGSPELLFTADGGQSFARRALPRGYSGGGLAFANARMGFLTQGASLWATRNGARTWRTVAWPSALGDPAYVAGLSTDRRGDLWIAVVPFGKAGREAIGVRTAQGRWRVLDLPTGVAEAFYAQSLAALSPSQAYLATPAGVYHTTDGGALWRNVAWPEASRGAAGGAKR